MITAAALTIALAGWPAPRAVFANCPGPSTIACGAPSTVDLSKIAPPTAKAVALSGFLIISYPSGIPSQTCNLLTYFRPNASHAWGNYRGQTVEVLPGGVRSNHSLVVPLSPQKTFDIWLSGPEGKPVYPLGCAYGANYSVDYWIVEP